MKFENLQFRCDGGVAGIMLDRPAAANELIFALAEEFCAAVALADKDPDVFVVVLHGAGMFFSAGGDVAGMAEAEDPAAFFRIVARKMSEGLLAMALDSDLVQASPNASFQSAYAGVGLTPECGVSYLLPRVVGPRGAAEICLSGRVDTASEALNLG